MTAATKNEDYDMTMTNEGPLRIADLTADAGNTYTPNGFAGKTLKVLACMNVTTGQASTCTASSGVIMVDSLSGLSSQNYLVTYTFV